MNILISFLLLIGLIVMISFIGPQVYKVNEAFLSTGKIPLKTMFKHISVTIFAILCYVIFAALIFIFLS